MRLCYVRLFPLSLGYFIRSASIDYCRGWIDRLDDQIYERLAERMEISNMIANHKINKNISISQKDREEFILNRLKEKNKLNHPFVEELWTQVFTESKRLQEISQNQKKIKTKEKRR